MHGLTEDQMRSELAAIEAQREKWREMYEGACLKRDYYLTEREAYRDDTITQRTEISSLKAEIAGYLRGIESWKVEAERQLAEARKALSSAVQTFSWIFAQTETSGADYGIPNVASRALEEALKVAAACAAIDAAKEAHGE